MITTLRLLDLLTPVGIGALTTGAIMFLVCVFVFLFLLFIAVYIYYCWVWFTLSKKLGYKDAWLAWIPIANLFLLPILAKQHWAFGFLMLIPIVNIVFSIIWCWDIYKKRKFSGALALVKIGYAIPFLIPFAFLADFIIMSIIAFEK